MTEHYHVEALSDASWAVLEKATGREMAIRPTRDEAERACVAVERELLRAHRAHNVVVDWRRCPICRDERADRLVEMADDAGEGGRS